MHPRAVVFDIGNVLLAWDPWPPYAARLGEARARAALAEADLHGMNAAIDLGLPMAEAVARWAARHPAWAAEIRLWPALWDEMLGPEIEGSVRLLRALRAGGVAVFALSNFGRETFRAAEVRFPFLAEFDARFISGELGVAKPDPRIMAALEAATGLAGPELLFVDDRADNIAAARARGWRTHRFRDPDALAGELAGQGLLSRQGVSA